jgi:hypothetical protein
MRISRSSLITAGLVAIVLVAWPSDAAPVEVDADTNKMINMHLDAVDQVIVLTEKYEPSSHQTFVEKRVDFTKEYNVALESEISKSVEERKAQYSFHDKSTTAYSGMGATGTNHLYEVWTSTLARVAREHDYNKAQAALRDGHNKASARGAALRTMFYVRADFDFDVVVPTGVTADQVREVFARFGPVTRVVQGNLVPKATPRLVSRSSNRKKGYVGMSLDDRDGLSIDGDGASREYFDTWSVYVRMPRAYGKQAYSVLSKAPPTLGGKRAQVYTCGDKPMGSDAAAFVAVRTLRASCKDKLVP